jgi:hypothetical protein
MAVAIAKILALAATAVGFFLALLGLMTFGAWSGLALAGRLYYLLTPVVQMWLIMRGGRRSRTAKTRILYYSATLLPLLPVYLLLLLEM